MDHLEFDVEHVNDEQMQKVEAEIASEKSKLANMSSQDEDLF